MTASTMLSHCPGPEKWKDLARNEYFCSPCVIAFGTKFIAFQRMKAMRLTHRFLDIYQCFHPERTFPLQWAIVRMLNELLDSGKKVFPKFFPLMTMEQAT